MTSNLDPVAHVHTTNPRRHRSFASAGGPGRVSLLAAAVLVASSATALVALSAAPAHAQSLSQISSFGSNPGGIRMYKYVPSGLPGNAPLVVALHGCVQKASDYDDETGWRALADEWKVALLLPEQTSGNNANECWNWFESGDIDRGRGEALSIKQGVDYMINNHAIDKGRIFVTGLSAGGAMTSVMLATYPDVFAGGAIVAGIPYRCGTGMTAAFSCMSPGKDFSPSTWGSKVRNASGHTGPWPRVSIWHGSSDYTVNVLNATEEMEQWTNVHGTDQTPDVQDTVAGYPHKVYKDAGGEPVVETYVITGMGHGTPVDPGTGATQCGRAGAYILDVDICSSYHIGKFWGLDNSDNQAPSVALTAPADGAGVSGNVTIAASASDDVGVSKVELFVDGKLLETDTSSPYAVSWDTSVAANGTHSILAKAFDAAGNVGTSDTILVTVSDGVEDTTPPTAKLTFPAPGDTVYGTITLAAAASDDFGVTAVEFFVDGASLGTGTPSQEAGPWTLTWNTETVSSGSHTITVLAYDAKGNVGESGDTSIIVDQNVLALDETFSDRDGNGDAYDAAGWSGSFVLASDNHTVGPAGSQSAHGYASSGINCITGTKSKSMSRSVSLSDNPQLTYRRKLDLKAAINTGTTAAFAVKVNGTKVDGKSVTYANHGESSWTERAVDLSAYANQSVTLTFETSAYSNICMEVYAKAWIDDIEIGNPQRDADASAPVANITAPAGGASISGAVDITASASDDTGVAKVELYVDGNLVAADTSAPYSYTWNTLDIEDGVHHIMAKAYDAAGNVGSDNDTSVTVSNSGGGGDGGGGGDDGSATLATFDNDDARDGYVKADSNGSAASVGAYESWYGLAMGRGTDGQYNRAVMSFDTSAIPDGATITRAYLTVSYSTASGDPWANPSGNELVIDIKSGCFGNCGIESGDWAAAATSSGVAKIVKFTSGTQSSSQFGSAGLSAINKTGTTQLRLRFAADQTSTNYVWFGNGASATLQVEYSL